MRTTHLMLTFVLVLAHGAFANDAPPPLTDATPAASTPAAPAPAPGACFSPKSDGDCDGPTGAAPVPGGNTPVSGTAAPGAPGKCFSPKGDGDCDGPSGKAPVANGNTDPAVARR